MKKTLLIALAFSVAGFAAAEDSYTSLLYNNSGKELGTALSSKATDITLTSVLPNKAFAYTLVLDVDAIQNVIGNEDAVPVMLTGFTNTSTNARIQHSWSLAASSTGFLLVCQNYDGSDATVNSTSTTTKVIAGPANWEGLTELALTVAYTGSVTCVDLTARVNDAVSTTIAYAKAQSNNNWTWSASYTPSSISLNTDYVDAAYVRSQTNDGMHSENLRRTYLNGILTDYANAPLAAQPSPAIPEPATATLSLLALAGLAARRRRK